MNPIFPIFIPSKNRADIAMTPGRLDLMGVPYRIVVEDSQYPLYRARYPKDKLLVIPDSYFDDYPVLDEFGRSKPMGAGPARNFIWDTAEAEGYPWHWMLDDNINCFGRLTRNERRLSGDGTVFAAMEDFCLRYENIGLAGPEYAMFLPSREKRLKPYTLNTRVFSTILIRNDIGIRWRGRYNEDVTLNIDALKAGWCVVKFCAFYQEKKGTQRLRGGMTEDVYAREGTLVKSQFLARVHPDIVTVVKRFNRWHHLVDFSPFADMKLIRKPDWQPPEVNPYQIKTVPNPAYRQRFNPDTRVDPKLDPRLRPPRQPDLLATRMAKARAAAQKRQETE